VVPALSTGSASKIFHLLGRVDWSEERSEFGEAAILFSLEDVSERRCRRATLVVENCGICCEP